MYKCPECKKRCHCPGVDCQCKPVVASPCSAAITSTLADIIDQIDVMREQISKLRMVAAGCELGDGNRDVQQANATIEAVESILNTTSIDSTRKCKAIRQLLRLDRANNTGRQKETDDTLAG